MVKKKKLNMLNGFLELSNKIKMNLAQYHNIDHLGLVDIYIS